jgi:hypothetical protein
MKLFQRKPLPIYLDKNFEKKLCQYLQDPVFKKIKKSEKHSNVSMYNSLCGLYETKED